jgi:hypothetical protein
MYLSDKQISFYKSTYQRLGVLGDFDEVWEEALAGRRRYVADGSNTLHG